jgi:hypothetical protein
MTNPQEHTFKPFTLKASLAKDFKSENTSQLSGKRDTGLTRKQKDNELRLPLKRSYVDFQKTNLFEQGVLPDSSEMSNSQFLSIEKRQTSGNKKHSLPKQKNKNYLSLNPPGKVGVNRVSPQVMMHFDSVNPKARLINQNRVTLELGMFFIADPSKTKTIQKTVKELKTRLLKSGIRMDSAVMLDNMTRKVLFDDRLSSQKFHSHQKGLNGASDDKSLVSATMFDDHFYNHFLLKSDSFLNVVYNTFLMSLQTESKVEVFKKYLQTMEELKTWMFQEFDEKKGFSNAEQFMKYFNLQVPIDQQYFSGLSVKDRVKLICFFFCKFFNRNILMTQFGDVWETVRIHHKYKTHSKM